MTLKEFKACLHRRLDAEYGKDETDSFYYLLVEHYLEVKKIDSLLHPEKQIESFEQAKLDKAVELLELNHPIQYIIGETEFFGLRFKVNTNVLIPRPETEELTSWIIKDQKGAANSLRILDVGTGSGCIAVALAKNLRNSEVMGIDVSTDAIDVARQNAKDNLVTIEFIEQDILDGNFSNNFITPIYDVIVSNPPYIQISEKSQMRKNVLQHEPATALYVTNKDPLIFYKKISEFALKTLKPNGFLYFEINEFLGKEMIALLKDFNFSEIELRKDIFGKDRMIKAQKI